MKKILTKRFAIGFILVVLVLAISIHENIIKLPFTAVSHNIISFNVDDDRELIGSAHNVFVAKVLEHTENDDSDIMPVSRFKAQVIYNIKGELQGTINIEQEGGYKNGILYTVHDGDVMLPNGRGESLLEEETTYLFFTRSTPGQDLYHMFPISNARKIISRDPNLSLEELAALAERDERVKELEEAYKNEILNETDVLNGYTRNTYESLQKESIED